MDILFVIRFLLISLLIQFLGEWLVEKYHVSVFMAEGELINSVNVLQTSLYQIGDCSNVRDLSGVPNSIEYGSGVLCECPLPSKTGNYDVFGRLLNDGTVQYLCVDGWYNKVIEIVRD